MSRVQWVWGGSSPSMGPGVESWWVFGLWGQCNSQQDLGKDDMLYNIYKMSPRPSQNNNLYHQ